MEVTAFIIELSAEVVKGMQGGNECWMGNNEKLRGEVLEGMVRGEAMDVLLRRLWGWRGSMQLRQSLRLDGRKVCNIKRADISQAGRNKATVCALPSIHLPLTREASVVVRGEG